MNQDFVELLRAFIAADVRFLIVGAYALALDGRPRATGDLDVWSTHRPRMLDVDFIGKATFIRNKRATGRPKDLADIEGLETRIRRRRSSVWCQASAARRSRGRS